LLRNGSEKCDDIFHSMLEHVRSDRRLLEVLCASIGFADVCDSQVFRQQEQDDCITTSHKNGINIAVQTSARKTPAVSTQSDSFLSLNPQILARQHRILAPHDVFKDLNSNDSSCSGPDASIEALAQRSSSRMHRLGATDRYDFPLQQTEQQLQQAQQSLEELQGMISQWKSKLNALGAGFRNRTPLVPDSSREKMQAARTISEVRSNSEAKFVKSGGSKRKTRRGGKKRKQASEDACQKDVISIPGTQGMYED